MLDNIKDSIKAKLYDFAYTPFMSSYIISWILFNHKYLLVYFGESPLDDKLLYLGECHLEFLLPLYVALVYVFVYPLFALGFYAATLWYKKWSKDVKIYIEKLTKIPEEEAKKIREISSRFEDEKDELLKKLEKKEDEYKEKLESELQPLQEQIESLDSTLKTAEELIKKLESQNEKLQNELNQANEFLLAKNDAYAELEEKIADLQKLPSNGDIEVPFTIVDDHVERYKILEYLHGPYDTTYEANILEKMYKELGIPKAVTRNILNDLIQLDILHRTPSNQIQITPDGGKKLVEMMRGIKQ